LKETRKPKYARSKVSHGCAEVVGKEADKIDTEKEITHEAVEIVGIK
jgi:hypothetical protein